MQFKSLSIARNEHNFAYGGLQPGETGGSLEVENGLGMVKLKLKPHHVDRILALVSEALVEQTREIATAMTTSIIDAARPVLEYNATPGSQITGLSAGPVVPLEVAAPELFETPEFVEAPPLGGLLEIKAGRHYETRAGWAVKVTGVDVDGLTDYPVAGHDVNDPETERTWTRSGYALLGDAGEVLVDPWDLVREIAWTVAEMAEAQAGLEEGRDPPARHAVD